MGMRSVRDRDENETYAVAQIGGALYYYDTCSEDRNAYGEQSNLEYIGQGSIYSLGKHRQRGHELHHFWRFKKRTVLQPDVNMIE